MIPTGTAPRLENPGRRERLRARIFIQYFDLETSEFIRFVCDKSEKESWALGDAAAVLVLLSEEITKGAEQRDDPKG